MSSTVKKNTPPTQEELIEEARLLAEEINRVRLLPPTEEIWCKINYLEYGHPVTPLHLKYKALHWAIKHPPDPRGQPMASRPAPYYVRIQVPELIDLLGVSERTAQRMLQMAREALGRKPSAIVTVEEFCFLHQLKEEMIQKKLHEIMEARWNKVKYRSRGIGPEDLDNHW